MIIIELYAVYLALSFIFAVCIGELIGDSVYKRDDCLCSAKEFFCCVFKWQVFVLGSKEYINKAGTIILEILTTLSVWHLNIIEFLFLCALEVVRLVVILFIKIFKKAGKGE